MTMIMTLLGGCFVLLRNVSVVSASDDGCSKSETKSWNCLNNPDDDLSQILDLSLQPFQIRGDVRMGEGGFALLYSPLPGLRLLKIYQQPANSATKLTQIP